MKKAFMLVLGGASGCAVLAGALAFSGPIRFNSLQVNADPVEYSVTFGWEEPTTVKDVGSNYVFSTTTTGGNKVGVVGHNDESERFYFHKRIFTELYLYEFQSALASADTYDFDLITGFAISFSGGSVVFQSGFDEDEMFFAVESEKEYKELSITPSSDLPGFMVDGEDIVTVNSLTIWYSC